MDVDSNPGNELRPCGAPTDDGLAVGELRDELEPGAHGLEDTAQRPGQLLLRETQGPVRFPRP